MTNGKKCQVLTFAAIKGGVGKSSLAILTARNLAAAGKRVCCIDADIQGSVTDYFLGGTSFGERREEKNLAVAIQQGSLKSHIYKCTGGVDLIPSVLELVNLRSMAERSLKRILDKGELNDYDYVIIDTPGTWDNIVLNGILAADYIISPHNLSGFDIACAHFFLQRLIDETDRADDWYILLNRVREPQTVLATNPIAQYISEFSRRFPGRIFQQYIPDTVLVKQAIDTSQQISIHGRMAALHQAVSGFCSELSGSPLACVRF